jgi:hypothetical protein
MSLTKFYTELRACLGKYDTWTKQMMPGDDARDEGFEKICAYYADQSSTTVPAMKQQFRCAVRPDHHKDVGVYRTVILNKAAALEARFIGMSHMARLADRPVRRYERHNG